jgi:uncharacterized protein YaiE (UPF0345 family)
MLKVNEYFDERVKSISFENNSGRFTIGVMEPGEYEFKTGTTEIMTVVSGKLSVILPNENEWQKFNAGESFTVQAEKSFKVKIIVQSAYLCKYE